MSSNKKYWTSVEELKGSSIVEAHKNKEFAEEIPTDEFLGDKESLQDSSTSRRDFLKYVGFSTAAATLASCEGPVMKSIPYVVQPERIVPGVANYYATTMSNGFDFSAIIVKTREGRPIKIERNVLADAGCNARVQASVLSLYDAQRVKGPLAGGEQISWDLLDAAVKEKLSQVSGEVVFLTQTFASPSTSKLINDFAQIYPNVRHVVYDTISEDAALDAFQARYGVRALPNYDFAIADTIVSVGADFLGDWQGGGFDARYAKGRTPENGEMSRHVQFESNMSISGSNADKRVAVRPSQQKAVLAALYGYIVEGASSSNLPAGLDDAVVKAARKLRSAGSRGVVLTGIPEIDAQTAALAINEALASNVMDVNNPRMLRQGNAAQVQKLVAAMNAGEVGALFIAGVNPAYSLPFQEEFVEGLKKVDLSVDFSMKRDETAILCDYVAATPHYLESWGDVQMTRRNFTLMQPTIRPLFDTRQFQDTLLKWMDSDVSYYNYIKATWENAFTGLTWEEALHDGAFEAENPVANSVLIDPTAEAPVVNTDVVAAQNLTAITEGEGFELELYSSVSMGDGQQINNPWLQELPDPITRLTWDNYLKMSNADAEALDMGNTYASDGAMNGKYARVKVGDTILERVPVVVQPGQARGSVSLAFGYGKREGVQKEMQVGVNAYPLYKDFKSFQNVEIQKAEGEHEFASVQIQNTLAGRDDIIKETTLSIFRTKEKELWNPVPEVAYNHQEVPVTSDEADIWEPFDRSPGHHFNMSIDLNACTGCGACVVACHIENNVPVVGKEEVRKFRDMHWLRIDRYYSSEETFKEEQEALDNLGTFETYDGVETAEYENPQVVFQPMLCQHCNHAPCETVCPVAATMHSREGQNMMVYNRCVGTRYCANNCPYKVRRFNWFLYNKNDEFDYHMNNDLGRMVLNPDVTVRSRGVMEKCSFCIQRTQRVKMDAKLEGRPVLDGEFNTACSLACDKGAIVFGDINDVDSEIAERASSRRMYHALEGLGTRPNVMYQVKITNDSEV